MADLFQGSALPNVSTSQTQQTTAPDYYTNYLSNLASQGQAAAQNAQFVGPTALQQQAFQNVAQNVGNYQPALTQAQNLTTQAAQGPDVSQFMNPYTQSVVNDIATLGQRNIQENLAPQATAGAVGTGQFGSQRGAQVLGNTLRDAATNISALQNQALQSGYTQALQAAQNQQQLGLSAGSQLGNLAGQQQSLGLNDVNALSTLGGQQQTIAQNQQLFPFQNLSNEAALLRGYTIPTSVASQYTGPMPGAYSPSPLSQIAGLGSLIQGVGGASGLTSAAQQALGGLGSLFSGSGLFGSTGPISQWFSDLTQNSAQSGNPTSSTENLPGV